MYFVDNYFNKKNHLEFEMVNHYIKNLLTLYVIYFPCMSICIFII